MTLQITTLGINVDARQVRDADRALDSFDRAGARADRTTEQLNGTLARLARGFAAVTAALGLSELIKYADTWAQLEGRLRLVTEGTYQLARAQEQLFNVSQRTRSGLEGTIDLYAKLKRSTAELAVTDAQRLRVTEATNKAMIISGASTQQQASAIMQLGQGLSANRLGGEELNAILEQTPRLAEAIAVGMGRTTGELKKMGEAGKLTGEAVIQALLAQAQTLDAEFGKMPQTVAQSVTQIENAMLRSIGVFDQHNQVSAQFASVLSTLADNMDVILTLLAGIAGTGALKFMLSLVASVQRGVTAWIASNAAARASAQATLAAATADVRATATASAAATARLAEMRAATAAATGVTQLALVTNGLIPAQTRAAAASAAHTAALAAQTRAAAALAAATSLAGRAVAAMGGPLGMISLALGAGATAWMLFGGEAKKAEEKIEQTLAERHTDIMQMLDKQIAGLKERARLLQLTPEMAKSESPGAEHALKILSKLKEIQEDPSLDPAARIELLRVWGQKYGEAAEKVKVFGDAQQRVQTILQGDKRQAWLDKNEKYLTEAERQAKELRDAQKELGDAFDADIKRRIEKSWAEKAGKQEANQLKQRTKEAQEYVEQLKLEAAQIAATEQQQFMLEASRKAAKAPTAALRLEIMELAAAYVWEKQKQDELNEAKKAYDAAQESRRNARDAELQQTAQAVERLQEEIATYGMGAEAVARYQLAKLQAQQNNMAMRGAGAEELAHLQAQIDLQAELVKLAGQKDELDRAFNTQPVKDFGDALKDAFGEAGSALASLASAVQDYLDKQDQFDLQRTKARAKYAGDETKIARELGRISEQQERSQIDAYANMTGAAKNFFRQGSAGYKALETAERAFRAYELAVAIKNAAVKLGLLEAGTAAKISSTATEIAVTQSSVAPTLAAEGAKASAFGVSAFAKSLASLPFPANVAAGAAVTALLVGAGVKMFGGGGGAGAVAQERQAAQGTGTVLGDATAKSESLGRALALLAKNSSIELGYTERMLAELQNLNSNISALAARVAATAGLTTATGVIDQGAGKRLGQSRLVQFALGGVLGVALDKLTGGLVGKVLGGVFNAIFGGKTTVEDVGLTIPKTGLGEVLAGGTLSASQYSDMLKQGGLFSSDKRYTELSKLGGDIDQQFTAIVRDMAGTLKTAALALGADGAVFTEHLNRFVIDIGKVSLKDLKGEELEKALSAIFSKLGDEMAKWAVGGFEAFQKAGEGYLETVVRVASGVEQAQAALNRFGLTAVSLADLQQKNGDVGAELVRQTLLLQGPLAGVADIMTTMQGTASELADMYAALVDTQRALVEVGLNPAILGRALINGAQGLDKLQDATAAYFDEYFSEAERAAAKTATLAGKFTQLGLAMPATLEGFRALVESIPKGTDAGQRLAGQVLLLAQEFADLQKMTGLSEKAAADAARAAILAQQPLAGVADIMRKMTGSAKDLNEAYAGLLATQKQLELVRINAGALSQSLIDGAGGLDKLQGSLSAYFGAYFSEAERAAAKTQELGEKFARLGLFMPATLEGFRALVDAIPKSTEAGQKLLGQLLGLSQDFADAQKLRETAARAQADAAGDKAKSAMTALQKAVDAQKNELKKAYDAQLAALQKRIELEKEAENAAYEAREKERDAQITAARDTADALGSLSESLRSTLASLGTDQSAQYSRQQAQAALQAALALARVSGKMPTANSLQGALSALSQESTGLFTNRVDYLRDYYRTALNLQDLAALTDNQLTEQEKILATLEAQKESDKVQHDAVISALDTQLQTQQAALAAQLADAQAQLDIQVANAQAQLDALHGIDNSVQSVAAAINQFAAALGAAQTAQNAARVPGQAGGIAGTAEQKINALYQGILGRNAEPGGLEYWMGVMRAGASLEQMAAGISASAEAQSRRQIPPAAGGWRETGGGARQMPLASAPSAAKTASAQAGETAASENISKAIADALEPYLEAIAENTRDTSKKLKKWDAAGMPTERA